MLGLLQVALLLGLAAVGIAIKDGVSSFDALVMLAGVVHCDAPCSAVYVPCQHTEGDHAVE